MLRVGDGEDARQDDVRRRLTRPFANRLLAQRLRLIGDGEAAIAVADLRHRPQELLGLLDEAGVGRRRDAHQHQASDASECATDAHAAQYRPGAAAAPSIDLVRRRAV